MYKKILKLIVDTRYNEFLFCFNFSVISIMFHLSFYIIFILEMNRMNDFYNLILAI